MQPTLALSEAELKIVLQILAKRVPDSAVYAFGSRTTGNARRLSDLDLAVEGVSPLTLSEQADLIDDFDESDLRFTVDVVDLVDVTPEFRSRVENDFILLQAGLRVSEEVAA